MVRAPLIWLDEKDPVDSMETAREEAPELNNIRELFEHLKAGIGRNMPFTTAQAIERARFDNSDGRGPFFEFLSRIAPLGKDINAKALGKFFGHIQGRIVDEYKLTRGNRATGKINTFILREAKPSAK
jgi:hypothetical protein